MRHDVPTLLATAVTTGAAALLARRIAADLEAVARGIRRSFLVWSAIWPLLAGGAAQRVRTGWVFSVLMQAGATSKAEALLPEWAKLAVNEQERALILCNQALCRLRLADLPGACAALDRIPRPIEDRALRIAATILEAHILARRGDGAAALERLDGLDEAWLPAAEARSALPARAHAYAAQGDERRASETLHRLFAAASDPRAALRALGEGPALALAVRQEEAHSPYRAA